MRRVKILAGKSPEYAWIYIGIPVIIAAGGLMHFAYEWSGKSPLVGIFAPVNESVWEHLKMSFWPMLIWWFAGYFLYGDRSRRFAVQWFSSCTAAVVCGLAIILFLFYSYTGALGIEILLLDILAFCIGVCAAQVLAGHLYRYGNFPSSCLYASFLVLALMELLFAIFTFFPPHLPLFLDFSTGNYGR